MPVPLIDLKAQYDSIRTDLDTAVRGVVESQGFVLGPEVAALEKELSDLVGVAYAIGCASGTDALLLPLKALGAAPGDEVIVPAFTFFASAGAVWNAGLVPVFADVDPFTFMISADSVAPLIGPRTRAIMPVHLFGQMAPMTELMALAAERDLVVLEDAAQAIGATQRDEQGRARQAGSIGWAGAFSFFPTKNLGAFGDGGLVATNHGDLADTLTKMRVHGGRQMYHHEFVGTNSRLDALQAAVLRAKLPHLDSWSLARAEHARRYDEGFTDVAEVIPPLRRPENRHVYNLYTVRARRRDELRAYLADRGIGSGVYYPVPLHLQECFADLGGTPGSLPVSEQLAGEVLSLPVVPELTSGQIDEVIESVRAFYGA